MILHSGQSRTFCCHYTWWTAIRDSTSQEVMPSTTLVSKSSWALCSCLISIFVLCLLFLYFWVKKKIICSHPRTEQGNWISCLLLYIFFSFHKYLIQLARWQNLSKWEIITQTAYFKSNHLLECLFSPPLFLGKQVTFNPSISIEWDLTGERLYLHSPNSSSFHLFLEYAWRTSIFPVLQNQIIALEF